MELVARYDVCSATTIAERVAWQAESWVALGTECFASLPQLSCAVLGDESWGSRVVVCDLV